MTRFEDYSKTLDLARNIYFKIYGNPKSHEEWANSFNIIGEINNVLLNGK